MQLARFYAICFYLGKVMQKGTRLKWSFLLFAENVLKELGPPKGVVTIQLSEMIETGVQQTDFQNNIKLLRRTFRIMKVQRFFRICNSFEYASQTNTCTVVPYACACMLLLPVCLAADFRGMTCNPNTSLWGQTFVYYRRVVRCWQQWALKNTADNAATTINTTHGGGGGWIIVGLRACWGRVFRMWLDITTMCTNAHCSWFSCLLYAFCGGEPQTWNRTTDNCAEE